MHRIALTLLLSQAIWCAAQTVSGRITDAAGTPLPFATVSIEGQPRGATASFDGDYTVELDGGKQLRFSYIGYVDEVVGVDTEPSQQRLDVQLTEAIYDLASATVRGDDEDPAYRIMREAAARREGYLLADTAFEVQVYVKGLVRLDKAPEKIFGQEIGDMNGLLDSTRAGIVYLSETFSTLRVRPPDEMREIVTASRVSGDPRGYSFNTARGVDFDLYKRTTTFNKPILSPLAESAPSVYSFSLDGARRTPGGELIYRISVAPQNPYAAAYRGTVYIQDSSFHLLDADLSVLGASVGATGLDTLNIAQSYRQRSDTGWEVSQRRVQPILSLAGFEFRGAFTAVYSDYEYAPQWEDEPFGKTVAEVLPEANKVDASAWEARPVPLTKAEQRDYVRKDSIRSIRESPTYRDSLDAERNTPDLLNILLSGYRHSNWRKRSRWSVSSPVIDNGFHPVTGLQLGTSFEYTITTDELQLSSTTLGAKVRYGWADKQLYSTIQASKIFDSRYGTTVSISGGRTLRDVHREGAVSEFIALGYAMFAHRNPLKLYQSTFGRIEHSGQVHLADGLPLVDFVHGIAVEERVDREVASEFSIRKRDRRYESTTVSPTRQSDVVLRYDGTLAWTPGQQFIVRPDAIIAVPSSWPTLSFAWRFGLELGERPLIVDERLRYLFLEASIRREDIMIARLGRLGIRASAGAAPLSGGQLSALDLHQYKGSGLGVNAYTDYLSRYLGLDPFALMTDEPWADAVVEHDFDGALWSLLPLLRRLRFEVHARAGLIVQPTLDRSYAEWGIGIGNIGFGPARFLRIDAVWQSLSAPTAEQRIALDWSAPLWRLGLNVPLDELMAQ